MGAHASRQRQGEPVRVEGGGAGPYIAPESLGFSGLLSAGPSRRPAARRTLSAGAPPPATGGGGLFGPRRRGGADARRRRRRGRRQRNASADAASVSEPDESEEPSSVASEADAEAEPLRNTAAAGGSEASVLRRRYHSGAASCTSALSGFIEQNRRRVRSVSATLQDWRQRRHGRRAAAAEAKEEEEEEEEEKAAGGRPVLEWSAEDVSGWVAARGGGLAGAPAAKFAELGMTGARLVRLHESELEQTFGVTRRLDRLRLMIAIEELKERWAVPEAAASDAGREEEVRDGNDDDDEAKVSPANATAAAAAPAAAALTPASSEAEAAVRAAVEAAGPRAAQVLQVARYAELEDVRPLGKEGMFAVVFRARWRGQEVVIKVPKTQSADELNELRAFLDMPPHENLLGLLAICTDFMGMNATFSLVMRFVECGSIKDVLRGGPGASEAGLDLASPRAVLRVALDVASGLAHLHAHGVVHRDVALRNVLLSGGRAVLCDFGLARFVADDLDAYYRMDSVGSLPLRWMAPEAMGGRFSRATDVWSFGVTMWELLSGGALPYAEVASGVELVYKVTTGVRLELPAEWRLPEGLAPLLRRCWEARAEDRPTVFQLEAALQELWDSAAEPEAARAAAAAASPSAPAAAPARSFDLDYDRPLLDPLPEDGTDDGGAAAYPAHADEDALR